MSMKKVREIMGDPEIRRKGYFDTSKIMFIYRPSPLESSDIEIYFDERKQTVTNIVLPKGLNE